jgi:plastocyanin
MRICVVVLTAVCFCLRLGAAQAAPTIELEITNHVFQPSVLEIPAGQKVRLLVINLDETPEEFESYELNREKVIAGHSKAVIFVGPLEPGEYPFFGEFNPKTAQGVIHAIAP